MTTCLYNYKGDCRNNTLCCSFNELAALINDLRDIFVLVWQQAKCVSNIIPLPYTIRTSKTRRQLAGQLFGMFILEGELVRKDT